MQRARSFNTTVKIVREDLSLSRWENVRLSLAHVSRGCDDYFLIRWDSKRGRARDLMYAYNDSGCCGSTIIPHPVLKGSRRSRQRRLRRLRRRRRRERGWRVYEARHKLRCASYRSAHVRTILRAYVTRKPTRLSEGRDFMTIFTWRGTRER